ncbi:MAG: hypothetical protein WCP45_02700 [Verrucomicrobiota bacterium]
MNIRKFVVPWSIAVGAMDAVTGLLLVMVPALILQLLGIAPPSGEALVFVSWIGVFVTGVGLSYAMVLVDRRSAKTVWMITAMLRGLVAAYVAWRIADGSLVPVWAMVALTDSVVAMVQIAVVRSSGWKEEHR